MTVADKAVDLSKFRHLYPFRSNYLDLNGLKYHYVDEGSGDPIIMLHGNPTWSFYYRTLIQRLSPQYRTVVPDHIGCGLSDKPGTDRYDYRLQHRIEDVEALIDHLNLPPRLTLIVHDWGGMIGMALAVRRPETVKRLIVFNTAAFLPPSGKRLPLRLRIVRNLSPLAVPAVLGLNLFVFGALMMASHTRLAPAVKAGLSAPYNSWQNRLATLKFVQDIPLSPGDPSYATVSEVDRKLGCLADRPMLICWGERDFVFDTDYLHEWCRRFPEAEVHTFTDAGHYLLEDLPGVVARRVASFLQNAPI
jgi:haloalkane dehalogenase